MTFAVRSESSYCHDDAVLSCADVDDLVTGGAIGGFGSTDDYFSRGTHGHTELPTTITSAEQPYTAAAPRAVAPTTTPEIPASITTATSALLTTAMSTKAGANIWHQRLSHPNERTVQGLGNNSETGSISSTLCHHARLVQSIKTRSSPSVRRWATPRSRNDSNR